MMEITIMTAIVSVVMGLVGGALNEVYAYLKMGEPLVTKDILARMFVGSIASILLVHAVLVEIDWNTIVLLGLTSGYFGVDVVDFFIKKPEPVPPKP